MSADNAARRTLDRSAHVSGAPEIDPEALYSGLQQTRQTRKVRKRALVASGTGAVLAVGVALLLINPADAPVESGWAGARFETQSEPATVALDDGSHIEAAPETALVLKNSGPSEVRVAVDHGRASFDVARNAERTFIVEAGDIEVRVIGTRFTVVRDVQESGEQLQVEVERGIVEVVRGETTRRLTAGERWSAAEVVEPAVELDPVHIEVEADEPVRPAGPTSAEVFDRARAARRDGNPREAAQLYESLLRNRPGDGRASLAAFELGRLRMDALGENRKAIEALRLSLRGRSNTVFRQDAMARLVRLYDAGGQRQACSQLRDSYLSAYPQGTHVQDVRRRCTEAP